MRLVVEIELDNAAFGTTLRERKYELNRIMYEQVLRHSNLRKGTETKLMDTNGNACGISKVIE